MKRIVNAETIASNPTDMENNRRINRSEIIGIDLISVRIEYVTKEVSDAEVKTSTTHTFFNGACEIANAFDNTRLY